MSRAFVVAIAVLLGFCCRSSAADPSGITVDEAKATAAGIRRVGTSKRLVLYTDLAPAPEIDRLPELFDQAFPQWCQYFHVSPTEHADWQMTGFLMKERERFTKAGLLSPETPPFRHGYSQGYTLWLCDQPSDYYRRHLLLHEGTHGFMSTTLGRMGPPWYAEGTAELMGTHRLQDGRLTLNVMPASRDEVPDWGRIRIIKDACAARHAMRLQGVIDYSSTAHLETEPYAWCWAAAILLDRHPRYRERFHELYKDVLRPDFNNRFHESVGRDWRELNEEWGVFIAGMEYGYDVARTAIDFTPGQPCPATGAVVQVAADRGWQNSGLRLAGNTSTKLAAAGRYQVGKKPQAWWCEPGGVSLRYYQGRPLGILLAAVRPDKPGENDPVAFLRPTVVGLGATLTPERSGTLYFKINHSAAELHENAGELKVTLRAGD